MEAFIVKQWKTNDIRQTVFDTTMAQYLLIFNAAVSEGHLFGRYCVLTNNCVQYASRVLAAGGVRTSPQPIPNISHNYIDRYCTAHAELAVFQAS